MRGWRKWNEGTLYRGATRVEEELPRHQLRYPAKAPGKSLPPLGLEWGKGREGNSVTTARWVGTTPEGMHQGQGWRHTRALAWGRNETGRNTSTFLSSQLPVSWWCLALISPATHRKAVETRGTTQRGQIPLAQSRVKKDNGLVWGEQQLRETNQHTGKQSPLGQLFRV